MTLILEMHLNIILFVHKCKTLSNLPPLPTVATRVLSKERHVVYNAEITVRRPVLKDQRRLLLCGIQPQTCMELVELYVENVMEVDVDEYTLTLLPGQDALLVHLHQPLATGWMAYGPFSQRRYCKTNAGVTQVALIMGLLYIMLF